MNAETHLALCESIALATSRMRAAAEHADWDSLVASERECSRLIEHLRAAAVPALGEEERRRKARLLRAMLDDDRAVREHTQPELARLGRMLRDSRRASTYGYIPGP